MTRSNVCRSCVGWTWNVFFKVFWTRVWFSDDAPGRSSRGAVA
jgi:hypothetical protein